MTFVFQSAAFGFKNIPWLVKILFREEVRLQNLVRIIAMLFFDDNVQGSEQKNRFILHALITFSLAIMEFGGTRIS